jgi:membrane protein DedA with SNARE-associated domain
MRVAAAMLAGVTHMPYGRFTLFNAAGGICWATLTGLLGYEFGHRLPAIERALGGTSRALLASVIAAAALIYLWRRSHRKAGASPARSDGPRPAHERGAEARVATPPPPAQ